MRPDDRTRLLHMLDSAAEAVAIAGSVEGDALAADRRSLLAIVRCVEIVGEAASRLSKGYRDGHPQITWGQIIGMRNRIVHAYFEIDADVVESTVRSDLPALAAQVRMLLEEPG